MDTNHSHFKLMPEAECPVCCSQEVSAFYQVMDVPVDCAAVFQSADEAIKVPRGDIILGFCDTCGYIFNSAFDPQLIDSGGSYEDQQGFSPTFRKYAETLVAELIQKFGLKNKRVLEIGCGKGDFLELLCRRGNNRGVGIDPKSLDTMELSPDVQIEFVNATYALDHGNYRPDFIFCRHTLEHIHNPLEFLRLVRKSIDYSAETPVFFEVPDMARILDETAFWDIYYEHCGYYNPYALATLFNRCGFTVNELYNAYQNQHLILHAIPGDPDPSGTITNESPSHIKTKVASFAQRLDEKIESWRRVLSSAYANRKRIAIWGSGSKCVGFMTCLPISQRIDTIVDINPARHGKFIPKFAHEIVSPHQLAKLSPDMVIIMNPAYIDEIRSDLAQMGLMPELLVMQ